MDPDEQGTIATGDGDTGQADVGAATAPLPKRVWSALFHDIALAGVTAACTVLLALTSFFSARAASDSDDSYALASQDLTDANFFYEQGIAALSEDMAAVGDDLDRDCLLGLFSEEALEFCDREFAEVVELADSDPTIRIADEFQESADGFLVTGLAKSAEAVEYQSALVVFAVGLALSAWASLKDSSGPIRTIFGLVAMAALIVGVIRLLTI